MMRRLFVLAAFFIVVFAVAGASGAITAPAVRDWYPTLHKPPWTPPAWLFGPVWTLLYACIATAGYLAWRAAGGFARARVPLLLFGLQLLLNGLWSLIFFGLRQPGLALAEIILLWISILATTLSLWRLSRPAAALFVPYLLWVTFAAVLNFEIWRLNR